MRTIFLIILVFLIQITNSSKHITFLSRGTTYGCDNSGNYVFDILIKEYEGVNSFMIILEEPSYASATCLIKGDKVDYYIKCTINGEIYPLELTKVELPNSLLGVDFEYSGWENIASHPVLDTAASCIIDEFSLSHFNLEPKGKVIKTAFSKNEYEFKIPGIFKAAMSIDTTLPTYKINVNYIYDNSLVLGTAHDCILSINDKINITHSKSQLTCKIEGKNAVLFFPTIATNDENEVRVYMHISEKYKLNSSFLCFKLTFLSVFLLLF